MVYAKPPFAGPQQVLAYVGRYTHRVAISIRMASLERAAGILNISSAATFKGLAIKAAEQWSPRTYVVRFGDGSDGIREERMCESQLADLDAHDGGVLSVRPVIEELPMEILAEVRKAAKHGGVEFLSEIIEYSKALAASDRLDETKLIDPDATK